MEDFENEHEVELLFPKGNIIDIYMQRYLELTNRFYDLFKHDIKNHQNAVFMAVELYRLTNEEKYLAVVEESTQKSLEQIEMIKKIEQFIYSQGNPGFYSIYSCVKKIETLYPKKEVEIQGDDIYVFADAIFPKLLELLIQVTLQSDSKYKVILKTSELNEDNLNKCNVEIIIHDFSINKNLIESILNGDSNNITCDVVSLTFYIAKMILYRYFGSLKLIETKENQTVLRASFLMKENDIFQNIFR